MKVYCKCGNLAEHDIMDNNPDKTILNQNFHRLWLVDGGMTWICNTCYQKIITLSVEIAKIIGLPTAVRLHFSGIVSKGFTKQEIDDAWKSK